MLVIITYIAAAVLALLALFINFRAKFILEKILKRNADDDAVLKMKYIAAVLGIADFALVIIMF